MDSMERLRKRAFRCKKYSLGFLQLSPAAREIVSVSTFSREKLCGKFLYWAVSLECERLIVAEDVATKIMIIAAMENMRYVSRHIGLIAMLCNSRETGETLTDRGGTRTQYLGDEVRSYLNKILEVPSSKCSNLFSTAKHWVKVLSWDYSKDKDYTQGLSEEEIAQNVKETRKNQEQFFYQSIKEELQRVGAGEFEKTRERAYVALDLILKYLSEHLNEACVADVLEFLERQARRGDYPKEWLETLAAKYNIYPLEDI